MSLLLLYFLKVSFCLAIVYLFYQLVLRNLTFYNSNRWYLAGYTFLSFFIPLINITPVLEKNSFEGNTIVQFIPAMDESALGMSDTAGSPLFFAFSEWGTWEWLSLVLLAGATIFLFRFIFRCLSFFRIRRNAQLIFARGMKLYQVDKDIIPFSFGSSVFVNSELHTEEELREIIRHEFVHVKQRHTIDIIWSEWLCIINWYNPFVWLLRSSIRQNLEFIADRKVLETGVDRKQYQYLLLKVIGNNHFSIAQKFNFSSLKKRIAMMNTFRTARLHLARFLFILPLVALILISFRQKKPNGTIAPIVQQITFPEKDTVPGPAQPNDKGYVINLIDDNGNPTLVIKDKNGKQVDRVLLTKWDENESYFEEKYGKLPPPPPPVPPIPPGAPVHAGVPAPAAAPVPAKLPVNVKSIQYNYDEVEVLLKNGKKESYDLRVPAEKKAYEKKYGVIVPTPEPNSPGEPPATPTPPKFPDKVSSIHVNNNRAEVWFKDGNEEVYDLKVPAQKEAFEKKYGNGPVIADLPAAPAGPAKVVRIIKPGERDKLAELCHNFEIKDRKAIMHLKNGQIEEYDLTDMESRRKFEKKFGKITEMELTAVVAPVAVVSHPDGVSVMAATATPEPGEPVLAIAAEGHTIMGEEEVLVTISRKTTPDQLEAFKTKMKERGIDLKYDHTDYKDGILVNISGTIKMKDKTGRFSATDFSKLVLSTVTKGERVMFKITVAEKHKVI